MHPRIEEIPDALEIRERGSVEEARTGDESAAARPQMITTSDVVPDHFASSAIDGTVFCERQADTFVQLLPSESAHQATSDSHEANTNATLPDIDQTRDKHSADIELSRSVARADMMDSSCIRVSAGSEDENDSESERDIDSAETRQLISSESASKQKSWSNPYGRYERTPGAFDILFCGARSLISVPQLVADRVQIENWPKLYRQVYQILENSREEIMLPSFMMDLSISSSRLSQAGKDFRKLCQLFEKRFPGAVLGLDGDDEEVNDMELIKAIDIIVERAFPGDTKPKIMYHEFYKALREVSRQNQEITQLKRRLVEKDKVIQQLQLRVKQQCEQEEQSRKKMDKMDRMLHQQQKQIDILMKNMQYSQSRPSGETRTFEESRVSSDRRGPGMFHYRSGSARP